ncbi:MAG: hypothetical protein HUU35_00950 [Armatimonadetes bacterium]|nr:hypothetical protein [Armatimonadota bacterium]
MSDPDERPRGLADWTTGQLARLAAVLGDIGLDDLLPPEFHAERLEAQISRMVHREFEEYRRQASRLRREHPAATPAELVEELFGPFLARATTISLGHAALDIIPLAVLFEGASRRHSARSLLGRQIQLISTAAILCGLDGHPAVVAERVLAILDEVHGLEQIRADLRRRGLVQSLTHASGRGLVRGLGKLVLGSVTRWVEAGRELLGMYARYSRLAELKQAVLRHCQAD